MQYKIILRITTFQRFRLHNLYIICLLYIMNTLIFFYYINVKRKYKDEGRNYHLWIGLAKANYFQDA